MRLSPTEQERDDHQRRVSDSWMQLKSAEIQHRNATIVAVGTLAGLIFSGAWWLSSQASKEQLGPVENRVTRLEAIQSELKRSINTVSQKQDRTIELIMELGKK